MRHHTTAPVSPIRTIAAVAPVAAHRRDAPAKVMLAHAVRFYRSKLRALAASKRDREPPAGA